MLQANLRRGEGQTDGARAGVQLRDARSRRHVFLNGSKQFIIRAFVRLKEAPWGVRHARVAVRKPHVRRAVRVYPVPRVGRDDFVRARVVVVDPHGVHDVVSFGVFFFLRSSFFQTPVAPVNPEHKRVHEPLQGRGHARPHHGRLAVPHDRDLNPTAPGVRSPPVRFFRRSRVSRRA